jgi:ubiquinone/menaquinone biosynthesis C-methylase UbiE
MDDGRLENQGNGDVAGFTEVDQATDARFFVEFLDAANALPDVQTLKAVMVDELRLSPGVRVLEVGCGTGDDARLLAALVGPDGRVVGIDASEAMIGVARARSSDSSLPVEFALGDVLALKFPDGAFDACRCERVLMHVDGDPARGIDEMARVTRPGGRVTRTIVHAVCDGIRNGRIGSQLPRLMSDAGLVDVEFQGRVVPLTHSFLHRMLDGHLSRAQKENRLDRVDVAEWWRPLDGAESRGQFTTVLVAFITSGEVPTAISA